MYSQNEEEKYIIDYFKEKDSLSNPTPPRWVIEGRPKTFLDIGCNDCETLSNTRALFEMGWKGVLVDASPQAIAKCRQLYNGHKGVYIYEYAISKHNGKEIFKESGSLLSSRDVGLVSTFHETEVARFSKTVGYVPIEVKTFKWKTFLNRLQIKTFDFISIDVEGDEMHILPDMDLSKTSLICLEWNSKPELKKDFEYYLDGFKLIYTSGENLLYGR